MSFLDAPAFKVLVGDLLGAVDNGVEKEWTVNINSEDLLGSSKGSLTNSPFPKKELSLSLSLVWLQGTITEVIQEEGAQSLKIHDTTGDAYIYDFSNIPGGNHPDITKGTYIGVIGQIWAIKPSVIIKGAKIMCLQSNSTLLKVLWADEIRSDRAFLLGLVEPDISKIQ